MIDMLTAKAVNERTFELVESLIEEHHELYLKCFDDTLKPKHHNLERIMRMVGPLKPISSMRFESFHKKFKNIKFCNMSQKLVNNIC